MMDMVAGVDEAGRGPLAGPVYAAAVILPASCNLPVADSKSLSAAQREALFPRILEESSGVGIAFATCNEIDELGILSATLLAMRRALENLSITPVKVLVDGVHVPPIALPCESVVRGDQSIRSISAASILAKVSRDRFMLELDHWYPQYGFASHKGYPTLAHRKALELHGPCPEHRRSFSPVNRIVRQLADE